MYKAHSRFYSLPFNVQAFYYGLLSLRVVNHLDNLLRAVGDRHAYMGQLGVRVYRRRAYAS